MYRIVKTFRVYDDANSECRMYRPGMTISGADADYGVSHGFVESDEPKSTKPASTKALKSAPENK